jgi:thioesterase domain-containing protein
MGWGGIAVGGLCVIDVPGSHTSMLVEPNAAVLAQKLEQCLAHIAAT